MITNHYYINHGIYVFQITVTYILLHPQTLLFKYFTIHIISAIGHECVITKTPFREYLL